MLVSWYNVIANEMHLNYIAVKTFNFLKCQKERFKEYGYIVVVFIFFRCVQEPKFEVEYWFTSCTE